MAVTNEGTRWNDIVKGALDEVVAPDDDVVFNVFTEASIDTDEDAPVEQCPCGEAHPGLVFFVLITIALINPPENPTMTFRVTQIMEIAEVEDAGEVRSTALSMWSDLAFQRQAATMPEIDIEQTG